MRSESFQRWLSRNSFKQSLLPLNIFFSMVSCPNCPEWDPLDLGRCRSLTGELGQTETVEGRGTYRERKWGNALGIFWALKTLSMTSFEKVWELQAMAPTDSCRCPYSPPPKALALYDFILICRHLLLCKAVLTKVHYQDC